MLFYSLLGFFWGFFLVGGGYVQAVAVPPDHFAYRCSSTPVRCALVSSLLIHSYTFQFGSKYTVGSQKNALTEAGYHQCIHRIAKQGITMKQYIIKTIITLIIIVSVSEIAKKSSLIGGILVSLPIVSVLAMIWLWSDTKSKAKLAEFSYSVFWLVIPSLVLFITLPLLLKKLDFGWAMLLSCSFTVIAYYIMITVLGMFNIKL
jgi:uncharacterized membrane protein (GlpM family)